jgi:hypothetical protein
MEISKFMVNYLDYNDKRLSYIVFRFVQPELEEIHGRTQRI